ncbi:lactate dehydrogenase protein [Echinococcus multilocularis]|uniref:L-lactate dehydrogenase n=1 Tax=Echinococcus multilocularis TaxID=6211 RepID=A0A087VWA4_ECHMU|nr:lactate dehydrogenase protein [Echinococcus multilocularis]
MSVEGLLLHLAKGLRFAFERKVSVVGAGAVGTAVAFAGMTKGIANTVALYDIDEDRCNGEVMDLDQGSLFLESCRVIGDITKTADSDIVVVTAGARQVVGESRLNLVQRIVDIFKKLIPALVESSPNCILVIVTQSRWVFWPALSGFPQHRVLGSGTLIDTARFRHILGEKLNVHPSAIHGYVVGEHGDSSVPVWSRVTVGGANLCDIYPKIGQAGDPDDFASIHKAVVDSGYQMLRMKGRTAWNIGLCCAFLCNAILRNKKIVIPVSTSLKDRLCIKDEVFASVPCVVDSSGVSAVINLEYSPSEKQSLLASVETLQKVIAGIKW